MKRGLFLAMFLALIPVVNAQIYYSPYISWPVGVLGGFNFANIYDNYAVYIDAIIFLLIFLGLGKLVFGLKEGREREEPGYKLLYIGLALLMTISLLLLESRMRFTLLDTFGPLAAFIILIFLVIATYELSAAFIGNKWIVFGVTLLTFLFFLDSFYKYLGGLSFLGEFIKSLFESGLHRLLYLVALVILLIGIFKSWKGKEDEGEAGAPAGPAFEEGSRPAPLVVGPSEPIIPEREEPRSRELPADVIATLQEQKKIIAQLSEQIQILSAAAKDMDEKYKSASVAGRAELARGLAEREEAYRREVIKLKERRKLVFARYSGIWNRKLNELTAKIDEQREEYERLALRARREGRREVLAGLRDKITNDTETKRAVEEQIKRLYAEASELVGESKRVEYTEEDIAKLLGEKEVMRPKPPLLSPAQEETQQALTEDEKIKPGIKKIDLMLKEISKKRKFFEDIERETFLLRLFTKKGMPRSNLLSEKFLDTLQDYLDKLDRSFDLYLRLAKKEGKGKYAEAISAFKEAYKKERLNFVEVQKYKAVRKEVRSFINYLNRRYPEIGEIVSRRLKKPTDLSSEIRNFIDHDNSLNDKEKELLHINVDKIDNAITVYSNVLSDFFNALAKCREPADVILALRP